MTTAPVCRMVRDACLLAWLTPVAWTTLPAQQAHQQEVPSAPAPRRPRTHEDLQPATLPPLPAGMAIADIVRGDSIYHDKGTCFVCHGAEGQGMPAAGNGLTVGLAYAQYDWASIDSLIDNGIPDVLTRSPIQMPPRGGRSDLTEDEVRRVAAYVWAISQVRGEPWPGGHAQHASGSDDVPAGVTPTTVRGQPSDTVSRLLPARTRSARNTATGGRKP